MIDELRKALKAKKHPGFDSGTSLANLVKQTAPYFLSRSGKAAPPLTVYWAVNSVCNLACKMCDVGMDNVDTNFYKNLRLDGSKTDIPIDVFKRVVDEVAPYQPMHSITSTEPLLYRPLGEAIRYTVSKGMQIMITTGGYTLGNRAQELAESGLSRLSVSIDGPKDIHNGIRRRPRSFERSVEGVSAYKEYCRKLGRKGETLANFTITNFNYDKLVDFYEEIIEYPFDRINFSLYNFVTEEMAVEHNIDWGEKYRATVNCLGGDNAPEDIDPNILYKQIQEVKSRDGGKRVAILCDMPKDQLEKYFHRPNEFMDSTRCMVNWFLAEILASGEVIPFTRCYHVPLGNVNDQSFFEIWNGEKARSWRRDLRRHKRFPACKRCPLVC